MKKYCLLFILTLVLASCGTDSHHFKIDGHFLNLNQGEFYVYSPDGDINGIDTIKVRGGRFTYETPCEEPCILVIVFPNFSMQLISRTTQARRLKSTRRLLRFILTTIAHTTTLLFFHSTKATRAQQRTTLTRPSL